MNYDEFGAHALRTGLRAGQQLTRYPSALSSAVAVKYPDVARIIDGFAPMIRLGSDWLGMQADRLAQQQSRRQQSRQQLPPQRPASRTPDLQRQQPERAQPGSSPQPGPSGPAPQTRPLEQADGRRGGRQPDDAGGTQRKGPRRNPGRSGP